MFDARLEKLAHNLVNYSCRVQPGEKCLIECVGDRDEALVALLIREVYAAGGIPFVWSQNVKVKRALLMQANKEQLEIMAAYDGGLMEQMQAFIGIRASENSFELSDVPNECMELYNKYYNEPVHSRIRVPKTKWVVLRYPNDSMSQLANMSTERFEDFYFNVCNLDYQKMDRAMQPLKELMEKTDKVHITGQGTDLTFSIKGMNAIKCSGHCNIPDGEIYTAPVKDSVEGVITYNTRSLHDGFTFENICLKFKKGRIVSAAANDTERINKVFDIDEGARYIGEFSFGLNPYINDAILDTLFDEKIAGSIHFTPGMAYDDAFNGNKSALHWDLVYVQTPAFGGGDIYFDGVLIRRDGRFVLPELEGLNPENLK